MIKKLNIAICDDSKMDREIIKDFLSDYFDKLDLVVNIDEFESGDLFLKSDTNKYNLLFLDIFMDGNNGVDVATELKKNGSTTTVIFCSASSDFAEASYDLSIFYYLVKPIKREKIEHIMDKFIYKYTSLRTIRIKIDRFTETFYVSDIMYVEPVGHHSIVYLKNSNFESTESLKELIEKLKDLNFVKVCRYAYVSLQAIKNIEADKVILTSGKEIPLSRTNKTDVLNAYTNYKLKTK